MHTHPHAEKPIGSPEHPIQPPAPSPQFGEERREECTCNDKSCELCLLFIFLRDDAGEEDEAEQATTQEGDEQADGPVHTEECTIQDGKLDNYLEGNVKP